MSSWLCRAHEFHPEVFAPGFGIPGPQNHPTITSAMVWLCCPARGQGMQARGYRSLDGQSVCACPLYISTRVPHITNSGLVVV